MRTHPNKLRVRMALRRFHHANGSERGKKNSLQQTDARCYKILHSCRLKGQYPDLLSFSDSFLSVYLRWFLHIKRSPPICVHRRLVDGHTQQKLHKFTVLCTIWVCICVGGGTFISTLTKIPKSPGTGKKRTFLKAKKKKKMCARHSKSRSMRPCI